MKSKYVNGTINKDIYVHQDADTVRRVDDLEEEIVLKQDKLTAGENITISEENVISADEQPGAFEVVYGETPFEDIFNAYHSGNIPVCTVNAETYYVSMMYGSSVQTGYAVFTNSQGQHTSDFSIVYPSTYSPIRTGYLESTANLVQTISADSTASQYPSAKAVWNQAAKYTKVKRFIGHIQDNQEGKPLILDSNNLADIYNAQTFGNQIVFIFDDTNKLTYRVNYCFIDNTYPEAQKIVVYATAEHADTEQSPTFGVSERYFDTLYAKSAAESQLLYPYTRRLQDKLTAGENITISDDNIISATNSSDSIYETTVYYNDTATFDEYGEASLGECDIPLDMPELKVTIDGTEHTLHNQSGYWSNDDEGIAAWIENGYCVIYVDGSANQTLPVKVEGQVLTQEFTKAVNNAITYYDVYLDNQTVTFNEQSLAELGQLNINPEQTTRLILTIYGQEYEFVWDEIENCFYNEDTDSAIGQDYDNNKWYLYMPNMVGNEETISLSSTDVKENFKEAVEAVGAGAIVFEVEYGITKSSYGAYTLLNSKTTDDVANAFYDGKPVYLMCRYGGTQIDQSVQSDRSETKYAPTNEPCITLWQVEYVEAKGSERGVLSSAYTIKTNVAKVCTNINEQTYKNIRLICNAGGDNNKFFGYEEEYGSNSETFYVSESNTRGTVLSFVLLGNEIGDIINAFDSGKAVYLVADRYGNGKYTTVWQIEFVDRHNDRATVYTIKTNVAEYYDTTNEVLRNIRLVTEDADVENDTFSGHEEESGSSDVIFNLTSAAPKLNIEEPTEWYLADSKTFVDVYEAFASGKTVYLSYIYNSDKYRYIVTQANEYGSINNINIKGQLDHYTICAESFNGIDQNGNVQMKYLYAEYALGGHSDPFILYNKTIPDSSSKLEVNLKVTYESETIDSNYTPDEVVQAILDGKIVTISWQNIGNIPNGGQSYFAGDVVYQLQYSSEADAYYIHLIEPYNMGGSVPDGITTNTVFEESNEWCWEVHPLNMA